MQELKKHSIGKRTLKILEDLAEALIPSGGPDYPGARDIGLVEKLIERVSIFPRALTALKIFAWAWEFAPLCFLKFRLFTWMKPEKQLKFLEAWEKSRLMSRRWLIMLTKGIFMAGFYNQPLVWEKIGYEPGKCFRAMQDGEKN